MSERKDPLPVFKEFLKKELDLLQKQVGYLVPMSGNKISQNRKIEPYIKNVIEYIFNKGHADYGKIKEINCYAESSGIPHYYLAIKLKIEIHFESTGINLDFNVNELSQNCSSATIYKPTGDFSYLFQGDQIKFDMLMDALTKMLFDVYKYTGIFYTISDESNKLFATYCKKNAKELTEFTNKRNNHKITYYIQH